MKKIFLAAILATGCLGSAYAQSDLAEPKKEKKVDQYFGVQLNDLIRQIISFNNNAAAANTNPFLFTYNVNSRKNGWGGRAGLGMTVNSSTTNDAATKRTSDINDVQARMGVDKIVKLSPRWNAGIGLDVVVKTNDDKTNSVTNGTTIFTVSTESKATTVGGGPMGWLRYNVTDRILLGTETSLYYLSQKNKTTIISSDNSGTQPVSTTKTDDGTTEMKISVPVVIYISLKF